MKTIEVKFLDDDKAVAIRRPLDVTCIGHGRAECIRQGEHSWFNHSMDSFYAHPELSNLPPHDTGDPTFRDK